MWSVWRSWWICRIDVISLWKARKTLLEAFFSQMVIGIVKSLKVAWLSVTQHTNTYTRELRDWGYCLTRSSKTMTFNWSYTRQTHVWSCNILIHFNSFIENVPIKGAMHLFDCEISLAVFLLYILSVCCLSMIWFCLILMQNIWKFIIFNYFKMSKFK